MSKPVKFKDLRQTNLNLLATRLNLIVALSQEQMQNEYLWMKDGTEREIALSHALLDLHAAIAGLSEP